MFLEVRLPRPAAQESRYDDSLLPRELCHIAPVAELRYYLEKQQPLESCPCLYPLDGRSTKLFRSTGRCSRLRGLTSGEFPREGELHRPCRQYEFSGPSNNPVHPWE